MKRTLLSLTVALAAAALVAVAAAGGTAAKGPKGKPKLSATPVFKLSLKPSQEVPRIKGLKADAVGSVTFDLERSSDGVITSGEVIFYVNYGFPGAVTITGLHVHQGAKNANGPIVVDSGVGTVSDTDGQGNVTTIVAGVSPATLQAILDHPRDYYVNLHTTDNPGGALRTQLRNPTKR
ncbi:MAG: CHRD domain-containing protein [Thermoleophilia bacterium]|nr:CHRD domain-containing protein [Thermoleophilia bacterium]